MAWNALMSPFKFVGGLMGRQADGDEGERSKDAENFSKIGRVAADAMKVKSAGISKSKAGQGKKGKFVVEDAPDDDDHYNDRIPIMAGAMPADGETVLIKVENTELTRSPDGTLIIRKSPTKAKPKRLSAAGASSSKRSLFTGPAASKPKKPAAKPPSRGKSSSTKSRASTPPASLSSRPRRAARHGSGFYNEEYQKKLKWVKGGGTTKNPYLID